VILQLSELLDLLKPSTNRDDTKPSEALWIRFGREKSHKTVDFRTSDKNQILQVYLDENGALVGIEIFP
jgi:hypothetical protein